MNQKFLTRLRPYFRKGGFIRLKTDDSYYFETALKLFEDSPFYHLSSVSSMLQDSPYADSNILTEFEMLFSAKGNPPICFLIAETC